MVICRLFLTSNFLYSTMFWWIEAHVPKLVYDGRHVDLYGCAPSLVPLEGMMSSFRSFKACVRLVHYVGCDI